MYYFEPPLWYESATGLYPTIAASVRDRWRILQCMELFGKKEGGASLPPERLSLVAQQRQEAFAVVVEQLQARFPVELKRTFLSHEKEYALTSPEDCMVAFAQQNREAVDALYQDIVAQDDYRAEQAVVKLLKLFEAYERMVALYAELRSYYPQAAGLVEDKLPPLSAVRLHSEKVWHVISE